jgi:hypothetical protein
MQTLIGKKIQEFTTDASEKVHEIERGSDQHLDKISDNVKQIDFLTFILARLNQNLRNIFNTDSSFWVTDGELKELEVVKGINGKLHVAMKSLKFVEDCKNAIARFEEERENFKEIAHDFKEFRSNSQDKTDISDLLNSL